MSIKLYHDVFSTFFLTQDKEQANNHVELHLEWYIKRYKKSNTFNTTFTVIQQATIIGYSIYEIIKNMIPENYKGTGSNSQCFTMQIHEQIFQAFLLHLLDLKEIGFKIMIPQKRPTSNNRDKNS